MAIKQMNTGWVPGLDDLSVEQLKVKSRNIKHTVFDLLQQMIGLMVFLYKGKGEKGICDNYC